MGDQSLEADKETFNMATASKSLTSDSTSLVDLKAEVFRKTQEALYNKAHGRNKANVASQEKKKRDIWSKSNSMVLKRSAEDMEKEKKDRMRIQAALEEKAAIYDRLKRGKYRDKDQLFLVNFDEDEDDMHNKDYGDEDEWVEYTDALGRSRKCHKSDLDEMRKRDMEEFGEEGTSLTEAQQSLLSEDMRRDILRQKWEREEEENLKKTQLHYNDILFDEARTHSAAFFKFSRNEADRVAQQDNLKSLHKETLEARASKESSKAKRKADMDKRLLKIRNKKRLKMGLPALPEEDPEQIKEAKEEEANKSIEDSVVDNIKALRQAEENRMRNNIVREWDIGKEGVMAKKATDQEEFKEKLKFSMERKVLTQEEWNNKKRQERPNEFAPPAQYSKGGKSIKRSSHPNSVKASYNNVPPPSSEQPVPQQKNSYSNFVHPQKTYFNDNPPCKKPQTSPIPHPSAYSNIDEPPGPSGVSLEDRLHLHKQFNPIRNEIEEPYCFKEEEEEVRGLRAEIAPPSQMEYFNSDKRPKQRPKGSRSHEEMAEAFLCGLQSNLKRKLPESEDEEDSD